MNTPDRLEEIAEKLRGEGYTVEVSDTVIDQWADRLRAAGYKVTAPGQDDRDSGGVENARTRASGGDRQPATPRKTTTPKADGS